MTKEKLQKKEDLDFQIEFYQSILEERPNFIEALMALGDLYTSKGLIQEGLDVDLKLSNLRRDDPVILYNLSCSYSLLGRIEEALEVFKKAVDCGYDDFGHLAKDCDLNNLKKDQRFKDYLLTLKGSPK